MTRLLLFLIAFNAHADAPSPYKSLKSLPYKKSIKQNLLQGDFFAKSVVEDFFVGEKKQHQQKLEFSITGLHPRDCRSALRKLAQYEQYHKYVGFIKESSYDNKRNRIRLYLSSPIMPFNMILRFKIPRIKKPGVYPFLFDEGFLKDLHGNIHVIKEQNRCLFYTTASWQGKHTGISNFIFEFFSATLAKISMDNLFRISGGK